jgi:hypothetical protein
MGTIWQRRNKKKKEKKEKKRKALTLTGLLMGGVEAPVSHKLLLKVGEHISIRQVELLQECSKSRVVVQAVQ